MKAMILAAGRGERMRPLTDICPKPLLSVGGKPLIVWHIERLARAGFTDIVINHAHLGHLIEEMLGTGYSLGVTIRYSPENQALETAGGIAKALPLLGDAPFLAVSGDVFSAFGFETFAARALSRMTQGVLAHLSLVDNPPHHPEGDFAIGEQARLSRAGSPRYTFSGIAAFRPELFAGIQVGSKVPLRTVLDEAMLGGRVSGEHFNGTWIDVGTPERLTELDRALKSGALKP
jgi:N-acetyl-alpha-D-muramate 1-phosphate uridylyltransferase